MEELFQKKDGARQDADARAAAKQGTKQSGGAVVSPEVNRLVSDVAGRLKVLDERYANLTKREQLAEKSMLEFERDLRSELKALQKRLLETRKHLAEVEERLDTIASGIGNAVTKYQLRELEAYIDMWQPVEFVTRAEAKKLLEEQDEKRNDEKRNDEKRNDEKQNEE